VTHYPNLADFAVGLALTLAGFSESLLDLIARCC
jgi:hypothetical protein